jgi:hypothetical protein
MAPRTTSTVTGSIGSATALLRNLTGRQMGDYAQPSRAL